MKKYNENHYLNHVLPIAQQVGYSVPYELFIEMINPKLRGNHWDWNNFVKRAVSMTEVMCYKHFSDKEWKIWQSEIKKDAMHVAKLHAESILEKSGVLEWDI